MNTITPEPLASPTSPSNDNPRKRTRTACTRCKHRKQRCDSSWPTCSNCQKANVACDKAVVGDGRDTLAPNSAYTKALQERIALLESQLTQQQHNAQELQQQAQSASSGQNPNALGEVVEFLNSGNFEAPAYVGSSSGLSLAMNLGEMVQATVWNKALPHPCEDSAESKRYCTHDQRTLHESRSRSHGLRAITIEDLRANSARPPGDKVGGRLLQAYLNRLHPRYPFLDPTELWRLHANGIRLATARHSDLLNQERFGIFKLYLVYAMGAMLLQLTEKMTDCRPESFYMTALQHISAARESRTIQNIEAMTLLVIYHLRSASSHGTWYMTGLAMRTCVDLGLHRKGCEIGLHPYQAQLRRRLFWTVYSLERAIAVSLGRPLSVSDRHIDLEMPIDTVGDDGKPQFTLAITMFQFRRLESRIHNSIYRADRPLDTLRPKLDRLYADLSAWKATLDHRFTESELDYPILHYNKALRLLIQPFLSSLPPADRYYRLCLRAAGDVCQTYKRLHQSLDYGHSFIAVQTVFVAGITILYCLWTASHWVWSIALSNDIRACSSVLFVMGERASWVKKYRDAFEILVNATMEKLEATTAMGDDPLKISSQIPQAGTAETSSAHASIAAASTAFASQHGEDNDEAMRMVMELANWIDHDEGAASWLPDFESLENLAVPFDLS